MSRSGQDDSIGPAKIVDEYTGVAGRDQDHGRLLAASTAEDPIESSGREDLTPADVEPAWNTVGRHEDRASVTVADLVLEQGLLEIVDRGWADLVADERVIARQVCDVSRVHAELLPEQPERFPRIVEGIDPVVARHQDRLPGRLGGRVQIVAGRAILGSGTAAGGGSEYGRSPPSEALPIVAFHGPRRACGLRSPLPGMWRAVAPHGRRAETSRAPVAKTWHDGLVRLRPQVCVLVIALGCSADSEPSPPPPGSGSPATAAAGATAGDSSDEDPTAAEPEPTGDCDPWGDPGVECGPGGVCSFLDEQCYDAVGTAGVDEPCSLVDADAWLGTCAPGLVCVVELETEGRCAIPCQGDEACGIERRCRAPAGDAPISVCVLPCDPFVQDCARGEGCYVLHPDDPTPLCAAAGPGVELDPCAVPNDCAPGHHCTTAASHMIECPDPIGCCTPLCELEIGDCVGINPICVPLGVPDAPSLGVCIGDL
jgi:hypothetical protein